MVLSPPKGTLAPKIAIGPLGSANHLSVHIQRGQPPNIATLQLLKPHFDIATGLFLVPYS